MTMLVNLTESLTRACEDLRKMKRFKGAAVRVARCKSAEAIRKDYRDDNEGRSPGEYGYHSEEEIEKIIRDYAYVELEIDYHELYEGMGSDSEFMSVEFDYFGFEDAFKAWLLPYVGGDASIIPSQIRFDLDNEFIRKSESVKATA